MSAQISGRRRLIWAVEDSPAQQQQLRRLLSDEFTLDVMGDGERVIERAFVDALPDVLLLDRELPGMSGLDACRFMRQHFDETSLPILLLTARGSDDDIIEGLKAGANDYVAKPWRGPELVARVRTLARVREQARELERRRLFEQQLLGIVSHDLRSPLNAIHLAAALLAEEPLPDVGQRAVRRIESASARATSIVNDLLDFTQARIGGGLQIRPAGADLAVAVERILAELEDTHDRSIHVQVSGAAAGEWDGPRLEQVVHNLVTNAIKYSPAGSDIRIDVIGSEAEARLLVHNGGAPIGATALDTIFEPMKRASPTDAKGRSVGLGLYIVKHIVEGHGGDVAVRSAPDAGTTFIVRLPRRRTSATPEAF